MIPGNRDLLAADLPLAENGTGYVLTIDADEPGGLGRHFQFARMEPEPAADPALLDSDADGILDCDETAIYGTDPGRRTATSMASPTERNLPRERTRWLRTAGRGGHRR